MNCIRRVFLFVCLLSAFAFTVRAAYIEKFPITVMQPDSSVVYCFVTGDEFYNWVHDSNGYTLIRDPKTGFVVYAELQNDELVSTGYVVGSIDPAMLGLQPHTIISASKREQLRSNFLNNTPKPSNVGGTPPISNAGQNNGNINNIVIYIRFAGESEFPAKANTYNNMFNDTTPNTSSMFRYFRDVSYGKTLITTTFYPPHSGNIITSYQDTYQRSYFQPYDATTNPNGYTGGDNGPQRTTREHQLLVRAVKAVRSQISSSLNIDFNNDGIVDNICFIVSGSPGAWSSLLWPHKWALYTTTDSVHINGKRVYEFNFQIETSLDGSGASVLSHEMFHTLGAPDLYRYSYNGTPIGTWDLMASNATPPQSTTAYMKYKYGGWIDSIPEITQSGTYTINNIWSDTNNAYKIASPNSATEFFVVEYRRTSVYWDANIPGSGLIIYRINTLVNGNSNGPPDEIYIFRPGGTNNATAGSITTAHFSSNVGRTTFKDTTSNPPCFLSNDLAGGIHITNIGSSSGATISFDVIMTKQILTASAGQGGSISPSGKIVVNTGSNQTFTFTPNAGRIIQSVLVDGVNEPAAVIAGSYTFTNISTNHTIEVFFGCPAQSLPIAESFDNNTFPPNCWISESATGYQWGRVTSGTSPSCSPKSGAGMIRYNCYNYSNGSTGLLITPVIVANNNNSKLTFWMYRDNGYASNADKVNVYLSPTQSISGLTPVSTVHRSTTLSPSVSSNDWYEYVVNLPTAPMSSAYVIFEGVSAYGNNIFVDDIKIIEDVPQNVIAKWNNYATANPHAATFLANGGAPANDGVAALTRDAAGTAYAVYADGVAASESWQNATTTEKYWMTKFSTIGFVNVRLTSKQRGSDTGPKDFKIQYRIGISGVWTDVANGTIVVANDNYISGVKDNFLLPPAVNNESDVFVRWLCTSTVGINNSTVGSTGINRLDVVIFGDSASATYAITASAGSNGTISPLGNTAVNFGTNRTFYFPPNTGYHIDSLFIDGNYAPDSIAAGHFTFENVTINHSIHVTFAIDTFTITATAGSNGTVSPAGNTTVNYGSNQAYTLAPTAGYHIDSLFIDGNYAPDSIAAGSYTFTNITAHHTIHATFDVNIYAITATTGSNGTILPPGTKAIIYGDSEMFTFMPTTGYHIDSVYVDGVYNAGAVTAGSYTFTNITANHTIHVTFAIDTFTITATAGSNGTVSPAGNTVVNYGSNQTFIFTPNTGYYIDSLFIDGNYAPDSIVAGSYTFINITANHTVYVTFVIFTYTISATTNGNGSISPSGDTIVMYDNNLTFHFTPNLGFHIDSVFIDDIYDAAAVADGFYTFTNITENHAISVTFAVDTFTITAEAGENGVINPFGDITVNYDDNQTFNFIPDFGYHIDSVFVDEMYDATAVADGFYTFTNITENHAINVTFAVNSYTVTASAGKNGTISPFGDTTVNHGDNLTFYFTPDINHHIDSVFIDNIYDSTAAADGFYSFTNISDNHEIHVTFTINTYTIIATAGGDGGMISPSGNITVNHGDTLTFIFPPALCYCYPSALFIDNVSVPIPHDYTYTFENIVANHTIHVDYTNDIAEHDLKNAVTLYPNPTTGQVNIESKNVEILAVEIYDMYGKLLQSMPIILSNTLIDVSTYASGIYTIRLTTENGILIKKLVKD